MLRTNSVILLLPTVAGLVIRRAACINARRGKGVPLMKTLRFTFTAVIFLVFGALLPVHGQEKQADKQSKPTERKKADNRQPVRHNRSSRSSRAPNSLRSNNKNKSNAANNHRSNSRNRARRRSSNNHSRGLSSHNTNSSNPHSNNRSNAHNNRSSNHSRNRPSNHSNNSDSSARNNHSSSSSSAPSSSRSNTSRNSNNHSVRNNRRECGKSSRDGHAKAVPGKVTAVGRRIGPNIGKATTGLGPSAGAMAVTLSLRISSFSISASSIFSASAPLR